MVSTYKPSKNTNIILEHLVVDTSDHFNKARFLHDTQKLRSKEYRATRPDDMPPWGWFIMAAANYKNRQVDMIVGSYTEA